MVQREGGSFCLGEEGSCVNQTGWSNTSPSPIYRADGLVSRLLRARGETTVLKSLADRERGGRSMGGTSAKGGNWKEEGGEEEAARVLFLQSLSLSLSHTLFC